MTSFADSLLGTSIPPPIRTAKYSPNKRPRNPVDKHSRFAPNPRGLHPLHHFIPRCFEGGSEPRSHLNGGSVLAVLNHLHIAAADICHFSKLLLGQLSRISQAVYILTEAAISELAHLGSFIKIPKITAKHASPFCLLAI